MNATTLGFLLAGVLLNSFAQLGLKSATGTTGAIRSSGTALFASAQQLLHVPAFWLALVAYGLSLVAWIIGLSRVPVSQAYPVLSLGYVVTAVLAWAWLGESLPPSRLIGIVVIMLGVYLVARA